MEINGEISETLQISSSPILTDARSRLYSPTNIQRTVDQLPERVTTPSNTATPDSAVFNKSGPPEATALLDSDHLITDVNERCDNPIRSEGITRLSSSTNTGAIVQNIESSNSPQKTVTSEDQRTTDNCGIEAVETSGDEDTKDFLFNEDDLALKHEVVDLKYLILNEDSIDLTWIADDDVYHEIPGEEAFEPKMDLLKEETTEDEAESTENVSRKAVNSNFKVAILFFLDFLFFFFALLLDYFFSWIVGRW